MGPGFHPTQVGCHPKATVAETTCYQSRCRFLPTGYRRVDGFFEDSHFGPGCPSPPPKNQYPVGLSDDRPGSPWVEQKLPSQLFCAICLPLALGQVPVSDDTFSSSLSRNTNYGSASALVVQSPTAGGWPVLAFFWQMWGSHRTPQLPFKPQSWNSANSGPPASPAGAPYLRAFRRCENRS